MIALTQILIAELRARVGDFATTSRLWRALAATLVVALPIVLASGGPATAEPLLAGRSAYTDISAWTDVSQYQLPPMPLPGGAGNAANIVQFGTGNVANTNMAHYAGNVTSQTQIGNYNTSGLLAVGDDNRLATYQLGNNNTATIEAYGNGNVFTNTQIGDGLSYSLSRIGNGQSISIYQTK